MAGEKVAGDQQGGVTPEQGGLAWLTAWLWGTSQELLWPMELVAKQGFEMWQYIWGRVWPSIIVPHRPSSSKSHTVITCQTTALEVEPSVPLEREFPDPRQRVHR
jgi:hypothetical protein